MSLVFNDVLIGDYWMTGLSHLDVARRPGALSLPAVAPGVAGNRTASLRSRLNRSADAALTAILTALPDGAAVLDVGCQGWTVAGRAARIGRGDLRHAGCDLEERAAPPGAEFRSADLRTDPLPWDDDS